MPHSTNIGRPRRRHLSGSADRKLDRRVYNRAPHDPPKPETSMTRLAVRRPARAVRLRARSRARQNEPPAGGMPAPTESAPPGGMPARPRAAARTGRRRPGRAAGRARRGAPRPSAPPICPTASRRGCAGSRCPPGCSNLFTKKNVPLSSWGTGIEFFRRKANFDFVLSFSYQNMSPPRRATGWARAHDAADRHRLRRSSTTSRCWAPTCSFVWHTNFNEWFGIHYGAGIGVAWVRGDILRISNGSRDVHRDERRRRQPVPPDRA